MGSDTPWHLEALGLPAHADTVAVRRAYAVHLRRVDAAADPEGFARLREAYEAARQWTAEADAAEASAPPAARADVAARNDADTDDAVPEVPTVSDPAADAAQRVQQFAATVAGASDETIRTTLQACLASLRMQYIDAPGLFEDCLVDRLAAGEIEQRPIVFAHASDLFHWQEIGHLATMGPRGQWIESVEAQRVAWLTLPATQRAVVMSAIDAANRSNRPLPEEVVRRWPDVRDAFRGYPTYLGLYIAPMLRHEWAARFEAMPAAMQASLEASARHRRQRATILTATPTSRRNYTYAGFLLAICLIVRGVLALHDSSTTHRRDELHVANTPGSMESNDDSTTSGSVDAASCRALYRRLDDRKQTSRMNADELAAKREEAADCLDAGLWSRGDIAPP